MFDRFQGKILDFGSLGTIEYRLTKIVCFPIFRIPDELQLDKARLVYMVYNGTSQHPLFILCWALCVIINVAEVEFLKSKEVLDLDLIRTISPKIDHLRPSETAPATKGTEVVLFTPSSHILNIDIRSKDNNKQNHYFTCPMYFRINLQTQNNL